VELDGRLVWCEWGRGGRAEAGFAFENVDAERHRALVELIFSDDASWMRSTYPRDDPFRSFGYLLTTLWRVTRPRWPLRRRAPRATGRWSCVVEGKPAICLALSARGGNFEILGRPTSATVRLELLPGPDQPAVPLQARVVRLDRGRMALEWQEASEASLVMLGALIAEQHAAAEARDARRGLRRRLQAVREAR
jgi:hypothetical protein